jgi:hypothetical protein
VTSEFARLRELVESALEVPEEEREQHLRMACGDDAGLLAEARTLLAGVPESEGFLEDSAAAAWERCTRRSSTTRGAGSR